MSILLVNPGNTSNPAKYGQRYYLSTVRSNILAPVKKINTIFTAHEKYGGWHQQDGNTLTVYLDNHYKSRPEFIPIVQTHEEEEHYNMHRLGLPYYEAHIKALRNQVKQFGLKIVRQLIAFTRWFLNTRAYTRPRIIKKQPISILPVLLGIGLLLGLARVNNSS